MKRSFSIVVLLVAAAATTFAQHAPGDGAPLVDTGIDMQGHARFFMDLGNLDTMFEYIGRYDSDQRLYDTNTLSLYNGMTVGGYFRVLRNLKAGAFYRLQYGARHDDDWVDNGGTWEWLDTSSRPEHVFIADATPRFLASVLPGNVVFSIKNRYEVTLYDQDGVRNVLQSLFVRPGLTWFVLRDREPVMNLAVQYGMYVPLNFSESFWYQRGPYVNVLYHLATGLSLDASLGYQFVYWTESSDFDTAWPNNRYLVPIYQHWSIDLGVIYQLDL